MRHLLNLVWTCCLLLFCKSNILAQFVDVASESAIDIVGVEGMYGNGVSLYDFNKDGLDDLTFCTNGNGVRTFTNNGNIFEEVLLLDFIPGDIKQATWVDFDNDNDADFFCTIYGGSCKLFRNENDGVFTNITDSLRLPTTQGKSFGAAWGDYDRDGFLDVYVGNYDFILPQATTNWLFHNNRIGGFEEVSLQQGVTNDHRATFQPAWIDINGDLFPELYVINDKYHGNGFYLNNGINFQDISEVSQLDLVMEAMSNSWTDFDNDLDFDVYVSNTTQGNKLMRNDGAHFTDVAAETGVEVNSVCWSALWMDFDHNGKEDLHVATNSAVINNNINVLFRNENDDTFYETMVQGDNAGVLATAMGDFNSDGYIDYVEMEQYPLGISIYKNNGGLKNWLKLSLNGSISNREGVGVKIYAYVDDQVQMRATFSGEGFLTQNSQYEILSLGDHTFIDSLHIDWPSGWTDRYYQVQSNQFLEFVEGETFAIEVINFSGHELCPGEEVILQTNNGFEISWSNGSHESQIHVNEPGFFQATATNEYGLSATAGIFVEQYVLPSIDWSSLNPTCPGFANGAIQLEVNPDLLDTLLWLGYEFDWQPVNLSAGIYEFGLTDIHGCIQQGEIELTDPADFTVEVLSDWVCSGETGNVIIYTFGGTGNWTIDWLDLNPDSLHQGFYFLTAQDENNCEVEIEFEIEVYPPINITSSIVLPFEGGNGSIGLSIDGGQPPYDVLWNNKDHVEDLMNIQAGYYYCIITDAAGCQASMDTLLIDLSIENNLWISSVYPNPFEEQLVLQFQSPATFSVFDAFGKIVFTQTIPVTSISINTSTWSTGFYVLKSGETSQALLRH